MGYVIEHRDTLTGELLGTYDCDAATALHAAVEAHAELQIKAELEYVVVRGRK